jgi:hypothetical protein
MIDAEAIQKGIDAHGAWKARLRAAVSSGKFEVSTATVAMDNQCAFGKWLYGLSADEMQTEHFSTVKRLHAQFHEEAAKVVTWATSGQTGRAEEAMGMQGDYTKVSAELARALVAWRNSLA